MYGICNFQAQKDAEILKSVVLPLEEEIAKLQKKVHEQDEKVKSLEKQKSQVREQKLYVNKIITEQVETVVYILRELLLR